MKKKYIEFTCFSLLLSLVCCKGFLESTIPVDQQDSSIASRSSLLTRSDATMEYMGHQYVKTNLPLSIEEARVMFKDSSLTATHMALRIIPENMDQLHRLEADKSLIIQYHPFGYELLPDPSDWITIETGEPVRGNMVNECETACKLKEDTRQPSPIYVLWPVLKPLPDNLNYQLLFNVYSGSTRDLNLPDPEPIPSISGFLRSYDNRLGQYMPLRNVRVECQTAFDLIYDYTDENGHFTLFDADSDHSIIVKLQNDKFVIRDGETSNVKSFALDINDYFYENLNKDYGVDLPTSFCLDAYKGAEYYFYEENDLLDCIPIYDTLGVSIDIHAIDYPDSVSYIGYGSNTNPYIKLWNSYKTNYTGASSIIFGHINHLLGHASHIAYAGYSYMNNTDFMIIESFASFVAWYNVYQYYCPTNQYLADFICWQGHQTWTPDLEDYYERCRTPLYVDLLDVFNQHTQLTYYNDDPISDVPIPFIISCSLGTQSFQSLCDSLQTGIGLYYTSNELSRFLAPYSVFLP